MDENDDQRLIQNNGGSGFVFDVYFSYKPIDPDWGGPGNGVKGKNGWIEGAYRYVIVLKHGDTYRIEDICTGY